MVIASCIITAISLPISGFSQLAVDKNAPYNDPAYLVQGVLLSTGVIATNITFNGSSVMPTPPASDMTGYFDGSSSNIGIGDGVLLATGDIDLAPGPNNSQSADLGGFGWSGNSGDPDLTQLAGFQTYDAAILEFIERDISW